MANVVVMQIDVATGKVRLGGAGTVYATIAAAMTAAEATADAFVAANAGTSKVVNNISNRVYVLQDVVITYEADVEATDAPGDGVDLTITRQDIACKWYCE